MNTSHPLGSTPCLGVFDNEKSESEFIANEIKRCTANMGGVIKWSDFAVLRKQAYVRCLFFAFDLSYSSIQCPFSVYRERVTEAGHTMQNSWRTQVLRAHGSERLLHCSLKAPNGQYRSKTFWHTCNSSTIHSSIQPSFERSRFHHEVLVKRLVASGPD